MLRMHSGHNANSFLADDLFPPTQQFWELCVIWNKQRLPVDHLITVRFPISVCIFIYLRINMKYYNIECIITIHLKSPIS